MYLFIDYLKGFIPADNAGRRLEFIMRWMPEFVAVHVVTVESDPTNFPGVLMIEEACEAH